MTHTCDVGLAIVSGLELIDVAERRDWDTDGNDVIAQDVDLVTDASHGFDDLRITATDGSEFRVTITRIG